MSDNILNFEREHQMSHERDLASDYSYDDPYDDYDRYRGASRSGELGDYLELILIDQHVISRELKPIAGSEHEYVARELGRGRIVAPPPLPVPPAPPEHEQVLTWLSILVGGVDALAGLEATRLPDEELDVTSVAANDRDRVTAIDHELARVTQLLFGSEVLTAARRLLVRAVVAQPAFLRGSSADAVLACAALTAVAKANDLVGQGRVVPVSLIRTAFNLKSAPNERAQAMARAVAPQGAYLSGWRRPILDVPVLGSPHYLVASCRSGIIEARDAALQLRGVTPATAN